MKIVMYIEECVKLISVFFPSDWIEKINVKEEASGDVPFFGTYETLNDFSGQFFKALNLSLIKGEYVGSVKFEAVLEEIKKELDRVAEKVSEGALADYELNQLSDIVLNELIHPISTAVNVYKQFYKKIYESLKKPSRYMLLEIENINYNTKNQTDYLETTKNLEHFIQFNIRLANCDHQISINEEDLKHLLFIHSKLKNSESGSDVVSRILFYKCNYLISKILARVKQDKDNLSFLFDNEMRDLQDKEFSTGPYTAFLKKMRLHYSDEIDDDSQDNLDDKVQGLMPLFDESNLHTYESFHAFVKYYKDNNADEKKLETIVEQFTKNQNGSKVSDILYNRRAYQITFNYLENNLLSFRLDNNTLSLEDINKKLSNIRSLQGDTGVKNYFPYKKVNEYLLKQANAEVNKQKDVNFSFVEKSLSILKDSEKSLLKNFTWCSDRNFIAFQSPYEECLNEYEIDEEKITVFSTTSIVLPISFQKERKGIKDITFDIQKLNILHDIKKEVSTDKEEIKIIKNDLTNADKKNIEILSIFSAVVLFVASDIQFFNKVNTVSEALSFMLVFGYCIGLFVILIWFVTRASNFEVSSVPATHQAVLGIWSIATIVAFLITVSSWDKGLKREIPKPTINGLITQRDSLDKLIDQAKRAEIARRDSMNKVIDQRRTTDSINDISKDSTDQ